MNEHSYYFTFLQVFGAVSVWIFIFLIGRSIVFNWRGGGIKEVTQIFININRMILIKHGQSLN